MPMTAAKRKEVNGKSDGEVTSRRGCFPRGMAAAELPVVPLVVTPEAALHARVSTPLSIETSPTKLSSQLLSPSTSPTKLSSQLWSPSSNLQPHSTPSRLHVSRRVRSLSSR